MDERRQLNIRTLVQQSPGRTANPVGVVGVQELLRVVHCESLLVEGGLEVLECEGV